MILMLRCDNGTNWELDVEDAAKGRFEPKLTAPSPMFYISADHQKVIFHAILSCP
jgi:hypothetical protein